MIYLIIQVICIAAQVDKAIQNLNVKGNLVSKQLILTGEAKCKQLQADRIVTEEMDITSTFSSETLQLNSLSPFRSGKASAFVELDDSDTINISGNAEFAGGVYYDDNENDDEMTSDGTVVAEFVQIHDQSQWVPVVLSTFKDYDHNWKLMKKGQEHDDDKLRKLLKQNSYLNVAHDHFKKSWLDGYVYELEDTETLCASNGESVVFQFNHLPQSHTYVQISSNFYILTDFMRHGTRLWMKVDGELVWLQSHHNKIHGLCQYVQHVLLSLQAIQQQRQSKEHLQQEITNMQQQQWHIPVHLAVKHIRHKIHIEFGFTQGQMPQGCGAAETILLQELENRFKLFAIDDFTLEYK